VDGYTDFKSHVTLRDEKGMFGIPFKRLLLAGCGGGMILVLSRIPFPDLSLLFGLGGTLALVWLTAPRGGIARWQMLLLDWQWRLVTAPILAPGSVLGQLARLLQLTVQSPDVTGEAIFTPEGDAAQRTDLADWALFSAPWAVDDGDGLLLLRSPGLEA
jgi:hypothetical protein